MRRGLVFLLLFMTLASQCLAIVGRADALSQVEHDSHAVLHMKGQAHHHLEDGSLQVDDSDESVRHLMVDCLLTAPGALPSLLAWPLQVMSSPPTSRDEQPAAEPDLAGLKRPPRAAS